MYEFFDLGLILINLLFSGLLLHRTNKLKDRTDRLENLIKSNIKNPKLARKLLNEILD
tara:strand:- start:281 stop:454 length:174 start_codon:yes stop_codon:yes gene_type:complete